MPDLTPFACRDTALAIPSPLTNHYCTADGVDVTEGDNVYLIPPYGRRIVDRRVGRRRSRHVHTDGYIPFVGGMEGNPAKIYFDKRHATARLLADVSEDIATAKRQIKEAQALIKRLVKLSASLDQELGAKLNMDTKPGGA